MVERLASDVIFGYNTIVLGGAYAIPSYCIVPYSSRLQDDIQLIMRTVSSPNLLDNATNIDPVLATEGWQTLMAITRESARGWTLPLSIQTVTQLISSALGTFLTYFLKWRNAHGFQTR